MQIVIELDEEVYCDIKEGYYDNHFRSMAIAIGNGKVLHKEHRINNQNGTYPCDKCAMKHSRSNYCANCGVEMEGSNDSN